ncbi:MULTISPECIES: FecR family protein [Methylomonas]|uniref:Iron dicitrate transport regulator FecR n=2 Tax=Methylomonas TaxID=416 RepID=A0A126T3Q3_9GAMM|nr:MULTISPECIES: FecR family protein [Methylomonas]AMK76713.1 iron dicitrate transport regulator FecR [Methylomonas denitrificans]OAI00040.1 iron dicitrate transport regulator FecR [Methylomonas methanica]
MKISAEIKAAARDWWVRLDSGKLSPNEHAEFTRWLAADPLHRQAYEQLRELWGALDAIAPRMTITATSKPKPVFWRWQWALPALAGGCLALWLCNPLWLILRADFHTGVGERRDVHLSDGSTVHLNSNSALEVHIDGAQRQLTLLQGEAWFEVSPDKARPFRVDTEHGSVTALGTAFNVRLRDGKTEVSVTEHSVAVDMEQVDGKALHTVVAEGQQIAYSAESGLGKLQNIDSQAVTAWQRGKLVFENRPLGEVVAELNRYHRGFLLINDAELAQRRVNGVFRTDQALSVLAALETSLQLRSTRFGEYLIVLHR